MQINYDNLNPNNPVLEDVIFNPFSEEYQEPIEPPEYLEYVETIHIETDENGNETSYTTRHYHGGGRDTFQTGFPPRPYIPPILNDDQIVMREIQTDLAALLTLQKLGA